MNGLLQDVVLLTKTRLQQQDIGFEVRTEEHLPVIRGNTEKLKQVLLNLFANAMEATPWGGVIALKAYADQNHQRSLVLEIYNTGDGIAPENMPKLFEPFYSTKNGGLGLGLPISKEIVERHQGRIEAESTPNRGTTFRVRLPVKK